MRSAFNSVIIFLIITPVLFLGVASPNSSYALNRIGDMKVVTLASGVRGLAILFEERPHFSLKLTSDNHLLLNLQNTEKTPFLNDWLKKNNDFLKMEEERNASHLRFYFQQNNPVREIKSSWFEDKKILYLEISETDGSNSRSFKEKQPDKPAILKSIRFGKQKNYTRMVIRLNQYPLWEIVYSDGRHLSWKLKALSKKLKKKQFGPLKRIKKVNLKRAEKRTDIDIYLESSLRQSRIFWLKEGNRLVMDIFDLPSDVSKEALALTPHFNKIENVENKEDKAITALEETTSKKEDNVKEDPTPPMEDDTAEEGFIVRIKIPKREKIPQGTPAPQISLQNASPGISPDKKTTKDLPPALNIDPTIEPQAENALPEKSQIEAWSKNLNSDEAYLFGRIQESWELRDYEKGTSLINQFLRKYPDSSLGGHLSFLRGDFQLYLLRSGRKELLPLLVRSYKDAVARYGSSKEIPNAYIKLAQANSFVGNYYAAIGSLNMVISKYSNGDHLPVAYITRGKVYLRMDQYDKAIEDFKTILSRFPNSVYTNEARFWIAHYFHNKGVYAEAEDRLREIEKDDPAFFIEHPEYLFMTGRNYFYLQKYDQARDYFLRALNVGHQPETGDLLLSRIGDTFHHQSKNEDAKKYYQAAVDYFPDTEGASIAKLRLAKNSSGVTKYKEVRDKNVNKPIGDLAILEMANKLYSEKQFLDAIKNIKPLIKKPTHSAINKQAKDLYYRAIEKELARLYEEKAYEDLTDFYLETGPATKNKIDSEALLLVANAFYNLKEIKEAIQLYSQIQALDLDQAKRGKFILNYAWANIHDKDDENAERVLVGKGRKAGLPAIDQQKTTLLLAGIKKRQGELKRAYDLYRSIVSGKRLLPDQKIAEAYLAMGDIANQQERFERARESLNRAIALAERDNPGNDNLQLAVVKLGDSYHYEKKYLRAIKYYLKGIEQGYGTSKKGYWETRFRLAISYMETGNNKEAETIFSQIAEEGGPMLQQKIQIKMGVIGLEKQLKRLPHGTILRNGAG